MNGYARLSHPFTNMKYLQKVFFPDVQGTGACRLIWESANAYKKAANIWMEIDMAPCSPVFFELIFILFINICIIYILFIYCL